MGGRAKETECGSPGIQNLRNAGPWDCGMAGCRTECRSLGTQDPRIVGGRAAEAECRSPRVQGPRNAGLQIVGGRAARAECGGLGLQAPGIVGSQECRTPKMWEDGLPERNAGARECETLGMQEPKACRSPGMQKTSNGATFTCENHLKGSDNWEAPNKLGNEAVGHEVCLLNFAKHLSQRLACTCCLHFPAKQ